MVNNLPVCGNRRARDWVTALRWMQWLLRQRPDDPRLLSQVATKF